MAAQALAESLERGFDTVLDGTGDSSIEKLASKVAKAREQGAKRVTAEYVTIDIDDALARAASRARRTGREVPEDVIRGTHESVSRVLPEAIKRDLFDEVRLWDNTGTPPELIYEKVGGVERILNPQRWEAFLRKNPDYVPAAGPRTIRNMAALRDRAGRIRDSLTISRNKKNVGMVAEELENAGLIVRRDFGPGRGTYKLPEFGKPGSPTSRRQMYAKSVLDLRLTDEGEDAISALLEAGRSARKIIDDELDRVARAPLAERAELAARKEAIRVERTDIEQRVRRQVNYNVERNFDELYQGILDPDDVRRFDDIVKFADDDGVGTSAFFDEWYEYVVRKYGDDPRFIDWWLRTFADPTDRQFLLVKERIEAGKNLAEAGASYRGWLIDLYRKTDRAVKNDSVREGALRELNDEIRDLTKRLIEIDDGLAAQRFEIIQEVLAENRPEFGTGDALAAFDRSKIRGKSGVKKADIIAEIEQYARQVPREWLDDYLTGHSFAFIRRGHFDRYKKAIRMSGSQWRSTLTHEMTHGHQYYSPQINAAERLYLSRRAQRLGDEAFRPKSYMRDSQPFFDLGTGDDYTTKVYFDGITELSTRSSEFTWHPAQARPRAGGTASEVDQELVDFWLGALLTL
jgi:predicted nuclease with TOPRIM domain